MFSNIVHFMYLLFWWCICSSSWESVIIIRFLHPWPSTKLQLQPYFFAELWLHWWLSEQGKNVSNFYTNMLLNGCLFCLFLFSASCCYGVLSSSCIQLHWLSLLSPFPITSCSLFFKTACLHSSLPNCSPPSVSVSPKCKAFLNLMYNILLYKLLVWLMAKIIDHCNLKTRSTETWFCHINSWSLYSLCLTNWHLLIGILDEWQWELLLKFSVYFIIAEFFIACIFLTSKD